jgi:hypothetical protein
MFRSLMIIAAADGITFGLGNLLLPDVILSVLGAEADPLGRSVFQTLGAAILGYGVVAWSLRDLEEGAMRRGVIAGIVISFATIAVVVGVAALSGLLDLLAWAVVAIHAAVAIGLLLVLLTPAAGTRANR